MSPAGVELHQDPAASLVTPPGQRERDATEGEEAAAGNGAAARCGSFLPQRRPVVFVPGPSAGQRLNELSGRTEPDLSTASGRAVIFLKKIN